MGEVGEGVVADGAVSILPVPGLPEVEPGDDLGILITTALARAAISLRAGDVVVVTHKVVSKAEGAVVDLAGVVPGERARELAAEAANDPRIIEVVLREAERVVRAERGVVVCETRHGLVCANAGVDRSNAGGAERVTLLPRDPDGSAGRIRGSLLGSAGGGPLGVIVSDTFGRPFRLAGVNVAVGVAGMPALSTHAGVVDPTGYVLRGSDVASADEIASAAELVMGKLDGVAVAVVRGLRWRGEGRGAGDLLRPAAEDIFRH